MNVYGLAVSNQNPMKNLIGDDQYDLLVNAMIARYCIAKENRSHYERYFPTGNCPPVTINQTYEKCVYYDASCGDLGQIEISLGFTLRAYLLMRLLCASIGKVEEISVIKPLKIEGVPDLSPLLSEKADAKGLTELRDAVPRSEGNDRYAWGAAIQATIWAMFHEMFHGFAQHKKLNEVVAAATEDVIHAAKRRRRECLRKHLWHARFGIRGLSALHEKEHAFNLYLEAIGHPVATDTFYLSGIIFYEDALKRDKPALWAGEESLEVIREYEADQTALVETWISSRMNSDCYLQIVAGALAAFMLLRSGVGLGESIGYPNTCRRHRIASGLTNKRASEILGARWVHTTFVDIRRTFGEAVASLIATTTGGESLRPWADYLLAGVIEEVSGEAMFLREKQDEDVWMYGRYLLEETTGLRTG